MTVDHIDEDKTNDDITNLQLLSREENASKSASLQEKHLYEFICPWCDSKAIKPANHVKHNLKQGKSGPFCSRSCAASYGRQVQLGSMAKLVNAVDLKPTVLAA